MSDEKNGNGSVIGLLRRVSVKAVVGLLLGGLLALALHVWGDYAARVAALEARVVAQDGRLAEIAVDVKWIKAALERIEHGR